MGENSLNSIKHAIEIAAEADKLVAISQMNSYKNNGAVSYTHLTLPTKA